MYICLHPPAGRKYDLDMVAEEEETVAEPKTSTGVCVCAIALVCMVNPFCAILPGVMQLCKVDLSCVWCLMK